MENTPEGKTEEPQHISRLLGKAIPSVDPALAQQRREEREQREREREQAARNERWAEVVKELGDRYAEASLDNFEVYDPKQRAAIQMVRSYGHKLGEHVAAGDSVLFFGPPGTGKDHLMATLMRRATAGLGLSLKWRNGMDLFGEIRDRMDDAGAKESTLIRDLATPAILAISDPVPPWGSVSEYQAVMLFRIIDARYRRRRPTWMTLNVESGADAAARMGASVADRLSEGAITVRCEWPSYRGRKR